MQTREFSRQDWWGFAGCVPWPNGEQPLISVGVFENGKEYVLVLDPTGGCLIVEDHSVSDAGGWILPMPFPTQAAARAFALGIPDPKQYRDFLVLGFQEA